MRLSEIQLDELGVLSSWIADLRYENNAVIMVLDDKHQYRIGGVPEGMFRQWVMSHSKGKYWHDNIRDHYRMSKI
jgi:hypothetical protein